MKRWHVLSWYPLRRWLLTVKPGGSILFSCTLHKTFFLFDYASFTSGQKKKICFPHLELGSDQHQLVIYPCNSSTLIQILSLWSVKPKRLTEFQVKVNSKSPGVPFHRVTSQRNFDFCANSARLLRKLDHVLLWILSNYTRLLQCSLFAEQRKFQWLAMFCIYTLPLAMPAQAKSQILTAICSTYFEVDSLKRSL